MPRVVAYFTTTKPNFLLLALVCVFVGVGTALWSGGGAVNGRYLLVALLGAVIAHAAVNILNEYLDYVSGLDEKTKRTPFSGGTGILPAGQVSPRGTLLFGIVTLLLTAAIGLFFVYIRGWGLFLVGLPGMALIIFYTQYITRKPWLCLLAPGLGFGPCVVLGIHYVLTGHYNLVALAASIAPLLLVSNLLLLNQFPDAGPDKTVGRRHFPILFGLQKSARLYSAILCGCYLWIVAAVLFGLLPITALIALLTAPLALVTALRVLKHAEDIPALVPLLGWNVVVTLATPVLLAVGLIIPVI